MNFNLQFNIDTNIKRKNHLSKNEIYDVLIIGGGPAGLNASLYAKRKGLTVGIITTKLGGQVKNTSTVDNYLGLPNKNGDALIDTFLQHVNQLDIPILEEVQVLNIKKHDNLYHITLSNEETYQSKTMIIATGAKPRRLDIPGENEFLGRGVAYCAICDAPLFRDKDVIIAGGGNSAIEAALDLEKVAKSVTLVHRSKLRADKILLDKLDEKPNIKILLKTKILEVVGNKKMTGIEVLNENGVHIIKGDGLFIEIGSIPNSDFIKNQLHTNERGEIITSEKCQTNLEGVFACGDVTTTPYKQIIISAAEGAKAALSANEYLNKIT